MRLSGPKALDAVRLLGTGQLVAQRAKLVDLRKEDTKEHLDKALVLWFPAPTSYSGEEVVELHLHGGPAVVSGVIGALESQPGLRAAYPGEFTKRRFQNGKIDLTQAEGLNDLINAETAAQRRQALRQLSGEFGAQCEQWRIGLLRSLGRLEAEIDFVEEELPVELVEKSRIDSKLLLDQITIHLDDGGSGERLREGIYIVILGQPNVGKSSILNYLSGRDAAIVSARAGTTRDVVEVQLDLNGYPVTVADTAGLRSSPDEVEEEGVRRALARAKSADIKLMVFDAGFPETASTVGGTGAEIIVFNKIDLISESKIPYADSAFGVSALTGQGMDALTCAIEREAAAQLSNGEGSVITHARHRQALLDCQASLERAYRSLDIELMAEDLRLAARALGRITGSVDVEDLLDIIFAEMCIGK